MNKSDEATPDTLKLTSCGKCGQPNMAPFDFHDNNSCATYAVKNIEGILKSAGWLSYDAALAKVEDLEVDYKLEREVLAADIGNLQQKVSDLRDVLIICERELGLEQGMDSDGEFCKLCISALEASAKVLAAAAPDVEKEGA